MKQIADSYGNPYVFNVYRNDDGKRWLYYNWAKPDNSWSPEYEFVFSRK